MASSSPSKRKRSNTASSNSGNDNSTDNITIFRLLLSELNLLPAKPSLSKPSQAKATPQQTLITTNESWELIVHMLTVPFHLERFITFGLLSSLNTFLRLLVILPFRLLIDFISFITLIRSQFVAPGRVSANRSKANGVNVTFVSLIVISCYVGLSLDMSRIYHMIKAQSSMKLYMMFGVLELSEKLVSTVGQDLLNYLFNGPSQSFFVSVAFYAASLAYLIAHTVILIYQTITLNIAANSYSNTLTTMLLSMQFSEIKSSVLKKIDKEGLFQTSCSDITERFQLLLMLFVIMLRNLPQFLTDLNSDSIGILPDSSFKHSSIGLLGVLVGPTILVIGSELVVDWVKHAYLTKFNKITPSTTYNRYSQILSTDIISTFKSTHSRSQPQTTGLSLGITDVTQQRLGLPLPALVTLFIVMTWRPFMWFVSSSNTELNYVNLAIVGLVVLSLIIFKVCLEVALLRWAKADLSNAKKAKDYELTSLSSSSASAAAAAVTTSFYNQNGTVSGGVGAMDSNGREIIYQSDEKIPEDISQRRSRLDKIEDQDKLAKVSRFRMFSKKIW
ncbi:hypothetical protein WICPIJ_002104 [Wickerhamomyces pijperi]|uniref:DUF747-domain-containing protein n=1 Tax=Wickerhamomyces pijperi TaxID=599730 RepID=A0A9P8TPA4_WICPI|nr:hypothetical protein WICPIJ_002104 [Wickerhamomyces pijperi]